MTKNDILIYFIYGSILSILIILIVSIFLIIGAK